MASGAELQEISQRVDRLATATLDFYGKNKEFKVEKFVEDGNGNVKVSVNFDDDNSNHFLEYQEIEYKGGKVVRITNIMNGGNWYRYDQKSQTMLLGTSYTGNGNAQWHEVEARIGKDQKNYLRETSRIQIHTDLEVRYNLAQKEQDLGFQSMGIWLGGYLKLSPEDAVKVLPNGRFITIEDLLASVVDPWRSNDRHFTKGGSKVPELMNYEGFPKLDWHETGPHGKTFVSTLDYNNDKVHGFAHPLKEDPDGWIVFVRYKNGDKSLGRVLNLKLDRSSVKVSDVAGIPTISANMMIDGQEVSLSIPERRWHWVESSEESKKRSIETRKDHAKTFEKVYLNCKEIESSMYYYYGEILNAAVQANYQEWVCENIQK